MANKVSRGHAPVTVIPMTTREVRFANHYLEHGNKTAAARHAGFQGSPEVLCHTANNLLRKSQVADFLRQGIERFMEVECITRQMVAQSLGYEAFADRTRIFDEDGDVLPPSEWPKELKHMLHSYETRDFPDGSRQVKVKLKNTSTEAKRILAEFTGMIGPKASLVPNATGVGVTVILEAADVTQTHYDESLTDSTILK